ncbi:disease resistance protein RPM [Spatholobus suberectus]|nr:disease resistance protein RPM [Spatholobus suberectus]
MLAGKETRVVTVANYKTEFRAFKDDAWYSVCVLLEGETLTVKYLNFSDENDEAFEPSDFGDWKELEDFKERFRPLSKQLQDDECRQLAPGARVCACHAFSHDDVRFYDAVVDGVQESEHSWATGEELCLCTFILFWLHGPNARNLTAAPIENICVVQPAWELDPVVASFLEMAGEKMELLSSRSVLVSKGVSGFEMVSYCNKNSNTTRRMDYVEPLEKEKRHARQSVVNVCSPEVSKGVSGFEMVPYCNKSSNTTGRMSYFGRMIKETRRARRTVVNECSPEVSCHDKITEDRDLEGTKNVCMILIANIDKELCPYTITEFLQRHTSVLARVFIFPSLSLEVYTRVAIMVDSEKEFQELCNFLDNPNCIITSSTGRPWVILEKLVGLKNIKASIGALVHISENISRKRKSGTSNNLKVMSSGTKEFKIASNMKDLFLAFSEHQKRLHKKLALEERRIFAADEQLT